MFGFRPECACPASQLALAAASHYVQLVDSEGVLYCRSLRWSWNLDPQEPSSRRNFREKASGDDMPLGYRSSEGQGLCSSDFDFSRLTCK